MSCSTRLLDRWDRLNTRSIVSLADEPAATVNQAVCNVFRCWVNPAIFSPRLDFAVREWARRSAKVRKALDRSDRERTEAVKAMFVRFGYEDEDAFVRARVLYYMQIGYYALDIREPIEARLNLTPHYLKAFTGVAPSEAEIDAFRAYAMRIAHHAGFRSFARERMSARYSAFASSPKASPVTRDGRRPGARRSPSRTYDFVIVGGGGHGLATAYYLAKNHNRTRVCVIEKGWLGGGNTGRNTTIVRSNYFYPESVALYDLALRLYEGLSRELNFNVMLSQRGILNVSHTQAQLEIAARAHQCDAAQRHRRGALGPERNPRAAAADDPIAQFPLSAERRRVAAARRHRPP